MILIPGMMEKKLQLQKGKKYLRILCESEILHYTRLHFQNPKQIRNLATIYVVRVVHRGICLIYASRVYITSESKSCKI